MGGCALQEAPPRVDSVDPNWAWTGEATDIDVVGSQFFPTPVVDANSNRIDEGFAVELERDGVRVDLDAVELEDWGHLSARVPEGLAVGVYDLVVVGPEGEEGRLDAGFTVTDNRADHLELDFEAMPYQVGEQVVVRIHLLDPLDTRVPEDFGVTLRAWVDGDTDTELSLTATGLGDPVGSGTEVSGTLGAGDGWVALSSTAPANVWLGVIPSDFSSPVSGDEVFVPFTAGELDRVQIDLLDESLDYEAGTPFPVGFVLRDEFGNALSDKSARLTLGDACGGTVVPDTIDFVGSVQQDITFLRATGESCTSTRLEVDGTATGESAGFGVHAGEVALLDVEATDSSPTQVTAGEEEFTLRIVARDAYLNIVEGYQRDIGFRDDAGGLDTEQGIGAATCLIAWNKGERYCSVVLERSAQAVRVEVIDSEGLSGWSDDVVEVVPADVEGGLLEHALSETAAGATFELTLSALDRFGNLVELDVNGADTVAFDDGYGTLFCALSGPDEGRSVFDCVATTAADPVVFNAEIASRSLNVSAAAVTVTNGPLADVEMTVPSTVVAGDNFTLSAVAQDAYGNAYTNGDPSLELRDSTGTLSPVTATLDSAGLYTGSSFSLTESGTVTITASQGGTDLGSASLEVEAAEMSGIAVTFEQPWAWLSESTTVAVRGVDAYGNSVPDFTGPVALSSQQSLFIAVNVEDFTDGEAEAVLTWDSAGLQDRIVATSSGFAGSSQGIDALDDDCAEGPSAALQLDGGDHAVSCILSGSASATADFSGSAAGASSVSAYHFHDGDGGYSRGTATSSGVTVTDPGAWLTELVVADADACGARATAGFWANDKGEAAGPLTVTTSDSTRTAGGSASTADATITVSASDCAGDVPTVTDVYIRTDLGEISSGASSTGEGLALSLSGTSGSVTWSAQNIRHDGTATVHAGVLSGAAHGSTTIEVSGESARPQVAWVDPMGATEELLDALTVGFTESLLGSIDYDTLVTVTGPSGELDLSTSVDDDELTVSFDSEQDASDGVFTLQLSGDIRDASGNKLDGDFDGTNAGFSSVFGDVTDEGLEMDSCSLSAKKITPDGDDGSGVEADSADAAVSSASTPEWWLLQVWSADGERVRTARTTPTGASDSLTWDARDDDGHVVAAGSYRMDVSAIDAQDNVSEACELSVRISESYAALE